MYVSKESKQVSHNSIHFMQVNDLDENKSWYKLRQEAGLDIVDDEEEEEKMEKEEEDLLMSKESKVPVYKVNK